MIWISGMTKLRRSVGIIPVCAVEVSSSPTFTSAENTVYPHPFSPCSSNSPSQMPNKFTASPPNGVREPEGWAKVFGPPDMGENTWKSIIRVHISIYWSEEVSNRRNVAGKHLTKDACQVASAGTRTQKKRKKGRLRSAYWSDASQKSPCLANVSRNKNIFFSIRVMTAPWKYEDWNR